MHNSDQEREDDDPMTGEQQSDEDQTHDEETPPIAEASDDELTEDEVLAREMVTYISRYLVEDQEAIQVGTEWEGDRLTVTLKVADDDKGKVIGRNGRVVRAMQSLLRVSAVKSNIRTNLDVV